MKSLRLVLVLTLVEISRQGAIKILDTPDGGKYPEPCALTCHGISRYNETGSFNYSQSPSGRMNQQRHDLSAWFKRFETITIRFAVKFTIT